MSKLPNASTLAKSIDYVFPSGSWMNNKPVFNPGSFCYPAKKDTMQGLGMPNPHEWNPAEEDWNLPENWEEIMYNTLKDKLEKFRSFKVFMDICVRCGACADKCHFFLGTGDPKNMPVLRAELIRSVYRRDFTLAGKLLGKLSGSRKLDKDVIKEWFYYFYSAPSAAAAPSTVPTA